MVATCAGGRTCRRRSMIQAFKLTRSGRRLLARRRRRTRMLQRVYGTAWPTPSDALKEYQKLAWRRPSPPRPPQARSPTWTSSASPTRSAPACRCSTPRAASSAREMEDYSASATSRRATSSSTLRTSPRARAVPDVSGHLLVLRRHHVPADGELNEDGGRQDYYLKAMNCPMHNLIFRVSRTLVP